MKRPPRRRRRPAWLRLPKLAKPQLRLPRLRIAKLWKTLLRRLPRIGMPDPSSVRRFGAGFGSSTWSRPLAVAAGAAAVASAVLATLHYGPPLTRAIADHPYFAVTEIVVTPTRHVRAGTLLEAADLRPGISLWRVDAQALAARLEAQPWVRRASVRREFPRRLIVDLTERQPAAILFLDQLYYVDDTGVAFVRIGERDPLDLPFVTGVEAAIVADERPFARHATRQALRLLRAMEAAGLPFRVSEVHIDREQGVTVFPIEPRVSLTFGWSGFGTKLTRLKRVLDDFRGREAQLREIDLTMGMEAVVRLRQSGGRTRGRIPGTEKPGVKPHPSRRPMEPKRMASTRD